MLQEGSQFCPPLLQAVGTQAVISAPSSTFLPLAVEVALKLSPPFHFCISTLLLLMLSLYPAVFPCWGCTFPSRGALSAQLQLPPGRSNVCWNPPPTLQSPLNFPPLHSVRTGQCLRASSAGITLVFMSTHSFVLSAGAVDAVITTAALCFPPSTAVGDLVSNTLMVQIGDAHIRKRALSKISSIKTTVELHPIRSCVFLSDHLQL